MAVHTNHLNLTWRAHPAAERPAKVVLGTVIMLGIAAAVWISFGVIWAVGSLIILFFSLNRFFLPTQFSIDETGITARYPLRKQTMRWDHVRRFTHDANGGFLTRRAKSSWTDAYSGMHLIFNSDREDIIAAIRARIAAARSPTSRSHDFDEEMQGAARAGESPCR